MIDKNAVPIPSGASTERIRRTFAAVDDLSLSFEVRINASGIEKFVDEQMLDGDLVAIAPTDRCRRRGTAAIYVG
jgi:hypothetical protein